MMTPESGKVSKKSEKKKSSKNKVLVKNVSAIFLFSSLQQKQIRRRSIIIVEDYDTKEIKDVVDCESTQLT